MIPRQSLVTLIALGGLCPLFMTAKPVSPSAESPKLTWSRCQDLPDPIGLKGMYAGMNDHMAILAGGSNFPVPARKGGSKTYGTRIYARPVHANDDVGWQTAPDSLPQGIAEGASVTTIHGIIGIGGQNAAGPVNDVFLLTWDNTRATVRRQELPKLPRPCANTAAAVCNGCLYVAGGDDTQTGLPYFHRLPLEAALKTPAQTSWETLPTWPGPPRFGAVLAVVRTKDGDRLLLCGGRTRVTAPIAAADYLSDAYLYDPEKAQWTAAAAMPHPALLAVTLRPDASHLAILGGSDGHDIERMRDLGANYRLPDRIMIYDAASDAWQVKGAMPLGVAGASIVELSSGWLVAGGEYSPGLRTPHVYRVAVEGRP